MHGAAPERVPGVDRRHALLGSRGASTCVGPTKFEEKGQKSGVLPPHFWAPKRSPFSGHLKRANKVRPNCWASPFWHQKRAHFPGTTIGPRPLATVLNPLGQETASQAPCGGHFLSHIGHFGLWPGPAPTDAIFRPKSAILASEPARRRRRPFLGPHRPCWPLGRPGAAGGHF